MIKRILLIIVVIAVFLGILYSMGFLDNILSQFMDSRLSLEEEKSIDVDGKKGQIILADEGYYIVYDNVLEKYDYNGQMADIQEFDGFIEKAYLGDKRFVKTAQGLLMESDGGYTEFDYGKTSKKLVNIYQKDRIFLVSSDLDEITNSVDIYDQTMKLLETFDSKRMRVIKTIDSGSSDGVIITTFSYEGSYMVSKIGEYLVEGMYKLWELDLTNELVVFQYTAKDGVYVATNENLYKINNEGSILWTYSGYDYIRDCKFSEGKIILLTGKDKASITTIDSEGKVEGIVETDESFNELGVYRGHIILSSSSSIYTVKDGSVDPVYTSDGVMRDLRFTGSKLRILYNDRIVELKIKID